jgi:hypothetical protein
VTFKGIVGAPSSEFSECFVQGMADRMAVSFHKYGPVEEAYPAKVDALATLQTKLELYLKGGFIKGAKIEPGNTEYLIDAANYCMIEFMYPKHPDAFFKATDSSGSNGRVWNTGKETDAAHGEDQTADAITEFYRGRS